LTTIKSSLVLAFLCLVLLVGSALAATSEPLYVQEGQNIVTYSVNKATAVTRKLGTLSTKFESVVWLNRSGSFPHILGFTSTAAESSGRGRRVGGPRPRRWRSLFVSHDQYDHWSVG
jgi:hypothetical protein